MNTQNWHFAAIRDAASIAKVNDWIVSEIKESGNPNLLAAQSLGIGSCWIGTVGILGTSKRADYYATELDIPRGYRRTWRRRPEGTAL